MLKDGMHFLPWQAIVVVGTVGAFFVLKKM